MSSNVHHSVLYELIETYCCIREHIILMYCLNCVFVIYLSESKDILGSTAVQKAKGFYSSCLDTKSVETAGVEPFLELVQKVR